jgi:hypothetical protein
MKGMLKKSALALAVIASSNASAALFFDDWGFNPNGTGLAGAYTPIDELTFLATSYIESTGATPGNTFQDVGRLAGTSFQNEGAPLAPVLTGLGVSYELTAAFFDWTGTYVTATGDDVDYVFNAGGTMDIYIDPSLDYILGGESFATATNGTNILSLSIDNGSGNIDFSNPGGIDGNINILFEVTSAAAGYWFLDTDDDGAADTDVAALLAADKVTIGLTDSNANITTPSAATVADFVASTGIGTPTGPGDIYVLNDGSFTLAAVPTPGVLALLGAGFLGLGWMRRKA